MQVAYGRNGGRQNIMSIDRPLFVAPDFPGRCKIFPDRNVMLLPFQQRWITDNSRLKFAVKARQIGFSWCTAYRIVREKVRARARLDAWIASRDEVQAQLFLQDAKRFAAILNATPVDPRIQKENAKIRGGPSLTRILPFRALRARCAYFFSHLRRYRLLPSESRRLTIRAPQL